MSIDHDVRLARTIKRLDELPEDEAPEGLTAFAVIVEPKDMTVAQLADVRRLSVPATMVTTDDGRCGWMLLRYSEKRKKGSRAKLKTFFYTRLDGMVAIDWLDAICQGLDGKFKLGGWQFPLKAFANPECL